MSTDRERPRGGPAPRFIGAIAEPVYRAAVRVRNARFDAGKGVLHAAVPVVSVGNLSVGGTGKTPMTAHLIAMLRAVGMHPGVAMRGYKSRPGTMSDEQAEYLELFPELPIAAQPDRVAGVVRLVRDHGVDCAVLDDGFQHRFLARDVEIVLIDAMRDPFIDRCLPAGWLREPVGSLARADIVVLTRCDRVNIGVADETERRVRGIATGALVCRARHDWAELRGTGGTLPVSWLRGKRAVVACGIGNPDGFLRHVGAQGAEVIERFVRRDHHEWDGADARAIAEAAKRASAPVVTTGKDWVKLRDRLRGSGVSVVWGRVEMAFEGDGGALLRERVLRAVGAIGRADTPKRV